MANLGVLASILEVNIGQLMGRMGIASETAEKAMKKTSDVAVVLMEEANRSINTMATLDAMAQKTGSSVETLSRLGKVATMTGTEFSTVDAAITTLAGNMATADQKGSKFAAAMNAIGISTDGIASRDPAGLFVEIADKLQQYEDGAGKAAVMTDAMGQSAVGLLPYMNSVSENIGGFIGITTEAAGAAATYQDQLGRLTVRYDEMVTSIVTAALPAANDFLGALSDITRDANLVAGTDVASWADNIAVGLARVVDVAILIPRIFGAVSSSFQVVAADLEFLGTAAENSNPINAAIKIAKGGNPLKDVEDALAKRNAVLAAANQKWKDLWTKPANEMEQAVLQRIDARHAAAKGAAEDARAGMVPVQSRSTGRKPVAYGGNAGAPRAKTPEKNVVKQKALGNALQESTQQTDKAAAAQAGLAAEMKAWGEQQDRAIEQLQRTNDLHGKSALEIAKVTNEHRIQDEVKEKIRKAQQDGPISKDSIEQYEKEGKEKVTALNTAVTKKTGLDIMQAQETPMEAEQRNHLHRMEALQAFQAQEKGLVDAAHQAIERETARHEQAKQEMRAASDLQSIGAMSSTSQQLYAILEKSGKEKTALGKTLFLVNKALAVAEIILNTNVAASKATADGGLFGMAAATIIRVTGYANAAMVAGMALADASAEGGYDIPAGENPVTQLHEKEMVLPKAQAEVIRGLSTRGGAAEGGGAVVTYAPQIHIDSRADQQAVRKMVQSAVQQGNADLVDKLQRAGRI